MKQKKVCMPVVSDLHHYREKQDADPDMHQSERSDPEPQQSKRVEKNLIKVKRCTNKNPNWKVHQGNGIFSTHADKKDYFHYKQCTNTVYDRFLYLYKK
jgi:hypothetical protein